MLKVFKKKFDTYSFFREAVKEFLVLGKRGWGALNRNLLSGHIGLPKAVGKMWN